MFINLDVRNDIRTSSSSLKHVMLQYFGVFQPSSGIMRRPNPQWEDPYRAHTHSHPLIYYYGKYYLCHSGLNLID